MRVLDSKKYVDEIELTKELETFEIDGSQGLSVEEQEKFLRDRSRKDDSASSEPIDNFGLLKTMFESVDALGGNGGNEKDEDEIKEKQNDQRALVQQQKLSNFAARQYIASL